LKVNISIFANVLSLKHFGAYFLLFVYSVTFGHQVLPHHHHDNSGDNQHQNTEEHNHCLDDEKTHNHVAHDDHFDEGLIDYFACVLGSHEHNSTTECKVVESVRDQNYKTTNAVANYEETSIGFDLGLVYANSLTLYHYQLNLKNNHLANAKSKRGPPQA